MLLKEDIDPVLVLSASAGCGKTTLASKLCQDEDIKGKADMSLTHIWSSIYVSWFSC